jgi:hypothetical protein
MEIVKKSEKFTILKKRSGRYAVRGADRRWINGDDKLAVLAEAGLAKAPAKKKEKPAEAPPAEAAATEESAAE